MRIIALIAGLAIAVAASQLASQAACSKRSYGPLIDALMGDQAGKCRRGSETAVQVPAHRPPANKPARYAADTCRYETNPAYDARGQVVYRPARICGRY